MSGPREPLDDDALAEAAAAWFVRLDGADATGETWLEFERWLIASPAHARAFEHVERLSVELDEQAPQIAAALQAPLELPRAAPRRARGDAGRRQPVTRRAWLAAGGAIAASLAVAVVFLAERPAPEGPAAVYRAAPGQTLTVRLADGTQVRLNAASTLKVHFARDARRIELADAEAAFDVTHDPKRPFLISVGDSQVRVVGTEFNIRHRSDRTVLTVRRGVVEVRPGGAGAAPLRLAAGQQFARQDGSRSAAVGPVDPSDAFAWTQGQLIYRDRPLSEVAADLSRRFGRPVSTADARTGALRFTGVLVTDSEPAVIRRLESFAPVKAERSGDAVVLRITTPAP
jgi:transmembrane sensor